ncbi:TolC family outer membrane protein [Pseudomonas knackmussii]|uniref:TolC family outer membrane protein n=1 Tax=Pseudomonas knackmussii TaxID=65741 RepID=UPI003F4A6808
MRPLGLTALCLACVLPTASALDLREAWERIQSQGPIYLSALHERDAARENLPIGRAGLLPQVNLNAYQSRINGTQRQPDVFGNGHDVDLGYTAKSAIVQARQPLFDKAKLAAYRQGRLQAQMGDAVFDGKTQDVAVQLAGRYFDVLLAEQTIELSEAKLRAFEEQVISTTRRFQLGDGTVTDVDTATARRDVAKADLIEARDNLLVARRLLEEYIGEVPETIATLRDEFPTPPMRPDTLSEWQALARRDNPNIIARRYGVGVAEQEVAKARAGHWPTLNLVAGYTAADSDSLSTVDQRSRYSSIGVELSVPLYAGGGTSARVRQTFASQEQAEEDLNATRESVLSKTTREFQGVQDGAARVRALEVAVKSNDKAVESSKKSFRYGSSTNTDILDSEQQLYSARRDLFEAKLRYLLSRLSLVAQAGALGQDDIDQVNGYLGPELRF